MLRKRWIVFSLEENNLEGDWAMGYKGGIELWMENLQVEWLREGIEQGFGHGACLNLQKLPAQRCGFLSPQRLELTQLSHTGHLELCAERVLNDQFLDDVFGDSVA